MPATASCMAVSPTARSRAVVSDATERVRCGTGSGPQPRSATMRAQKNWSVTSGQTTLGRLNRRAAAVVPAPP